LNIFDLGKFNSGQVLCVQYGKVKENVAILAHFGQLFSLGFEISDSVLDFGQNADRQGGAIEALRAG